MNTEPVIDGQQSALNFLSVLFQRARPVEEILAAIDKYSSLLPQGFNKVRAAMAKNNRAAAEMHMRVAMQPDDRL